MPSQHASLSPIAAEFDAIDQQLYALGLKFRDCGDLYMQHCLESVRSNVRNYKKSALENSSAFAPGAPQPQPAAVQEPVQAAVQEPAAHTFKAAAVQFAEARPAANMPREKAAENTASAKAESADAPATPAAQSAAFIAADPARADALLRAVDAFKSEKDSLRWVSRLEEAGFEAFAIASGNETVWQRTGSMHGDTLCAVQGDGYIFVIPSPNDLALRNPQIARWFTVNGNGAKYRLGAPAVGRLVGNGGFVPEEKGVIYRDERD